VATAYRYMVATMKNITMCTALVVEDMQRLSSEAMMVQE
jgi:hypothetical protein